MAGRKAIALGPKGEGIVEAGLKRGDSSEKIHAALQAAGISLSLRTVKTRLASRRGRLRSERADRGKRKGPREVKPAAPPLQGAYRPPAPLDTENATPASLDDALRAATAGMNRAKEEGNLPLFATMLRSVKDIHDALRKAKPEEDDPDDDPDLRVLGQKAAAEMHKMVEQVIGAKP